MPDDRDSITEPDNEFTELAKQLGDELLDSDDPPADPATQGNGELEADENVFDPETGRFRVGIRWDEFGPDTPIGGIGGRVRDFRRIRFGRPSPPFKSGAFNDDDGCLRGCFYPFGCLGLFLLALFLTIVGGLWWLSGDADDANLVSSPGIEASPSASASPDPTSEPSPEASEEPSPEATEEATPVATETPAASGPISVSGSSAVDHPPFARTYTNVGASVLLACLSGDADALAGAIALILFEGAGLRSTTFSGEFDSNGDAVIEVPIQAFGPFEWSATGGEAPDGTPLELIGGHEGTVGSDENPDACGP